MTAREFLGYALMAVGGLMTVLCGLCTLTFFVMGAAGLGKAGEQGVYGVMMLVASLIFGGLPTAAGVGLFVAGRALRKP